MRVSDHGKRLLAYALVAHRYTTYAQNTRPFWSRRKNNGKSCVPVATLKRSKKNISNEKKKKNARTAKRVWIYVLEICNCNRINTNIVDRSAIRVNC